ncbi:MAG: hypothetical protein EBZ74_13125 [Planctomycetia bacterium]|nr:hypothetical protein [Planctomycetia bacterium]
MDDEKNHKKQQYEKQYETIILSGGAIRALALLGCLQFLKDTKQLDSIKRYVGTSMGAIISYFICIGYSPDELICELSRSEWLRTIKKKLSVFGLITRKGVLQYEEVMYPFLKSFTFKKMDYVPTLLQVYQLYKKELIMCSYNLTKKTECFISYESHPDISCLEAIRMTSSLPFLFEPHIYECEIYVDGAVLHNFPIHYLNNHKDKALTTIGISVMNEENISVEKIEKDNYTEKMDMGFFEYLWNIIVIPLQYLYKHENETFKHLYDVFEIKIERTSPFNFTIDTKTLLDIFSDGYEKLKKQMHISSS